MKAENSAIKDLEKVVNLKKPVPMKGETPHRKGKIMSGRFPKKAAQNFIVLLKSLSSNASDIRRMFEYVYHARKILEEKT